MDGDQWKLSVGIPVLRFGCLTAGVAVTLSQGLLLRVTLKIVQGLARCQKLHPSPHETGWTDWILQENAQRWDEGLSTTGNCYLLGPQEDPWHCSCYSTLEPHRAPNTGPWPTWQCPHHPNQTETWKNPTWDWLSKCQSTCNQCKCRLVHQYCVKGVWNERFCWQVQWTWWSVRLPCGSGDLDSDWGLSHSGSEFVCKWMTEVGDTAVECRIGGWNGAPGMNLGKMQAAATVVSLVVGALDAPLVLSWWWQRSLTIFSASNTSLPCSCPSNCAIWLSNDCNFTISSLTSNACDTQPSIGFCMGTGIPTVFPKQVTQVFTSLLMRSSCKFLLVFNNF